MRHIRLTSRSHGVVVLLVFLAVLFCSVSGIITLDNNEVKSFTSNQEPFLANIDKEDTIMAIRVTSLNQVRVQLFVKFHPTNKKPDRTEYAGREDMNWKTGLDNDVEVRVDHKMIKQAFPTLQYGMKGFLTMAVHTDGEPNFQISIQDTSEQAVHLYANQVVPVALSKDKSYTFSYTVATDKVDTFLYFFTRYGHLYVTPQKVEQYGLATTFTESDRNRFGKLNQHNFVNNSLALYKDDKNYFKYPGLYTFTLSAKEDTYVELKAGTREDTPLFNGHPHIDQVKQHEKIVFRFDLEKRFRPIELMITIFSGTPEFEVALLLNWTDTGKSGKNELTPIKTQIFEKTNEGMLLVSMFINATQADVVKAAGVEVDQSKYVNWKLRAHIEGKSALTTPFAVSVITADTPVLLTIGMPHYRRIDTSLALRSHNYLFSQDHDSSSIVFMRLHLINDIPKGTRDIKPFIVMKYRSKDITPGSKTNEWQEINLKDISVVLSDYLTGIYEIKFRVKRGDYLISLQNIGELRGNRTSGFYSIMLRQITSRIYIGCNAEYSSPIDREPSRLVLPIRESGNIHFHLRSRNGTMALQVASEYSKIQSGDFDVKLTKTERIKGVYDEYVYVSDSKAKDLFLQVKCTSCDALGADNAYYNLEVIVNKGLGKRESMSKVLGPKIFRLIRNDFTDTELQLKLNYDEIASETITTPIRRVDYVLLVAAKQEDLEQVKSSGFILDDMGTNKVKSAFVTTKLGMKLTKPIVRGQPVVITDIKLPLGQYYAVLRANIHVGEEWHPPVQLFSEVKQFEISKTKQKSVFITLFFIAGIVLLFGFIAFYFWKRKEMEFNSTRERLDSAKSIVKYKYNTVTKGFRL